MIFCDTCNTCNVIMQKSVFFGDTVTEIANTIVGES